jgi:hypothetical protein
MNARRESRTGLKLLGVAGFSVVCAALPLQLAHGGSKDAISISARVLQAGTPANEDLQVTFEIHTTATGNTLVWGPEPQTVACRNGLMTARIPEDQTNYPLGTTFKTVLNGTTDRYVAIKRNGTEIVPRIKLSAVPYAQGAFAAEVTSQISDGSSTWAIADLEARYVNIDSDLGWGLEKSASKVRVSTEVASASITGGGGTPLAVSAPNVDGDRLGIDYSPTNYTRTYSGTQAQADTELAAHLKGIDGALATAGGNASPDPLVAGGRLSASTAAVTTQDTTSATLYYVPYLSSKLSLWNGSSWQLEDIGSSVSISVSSLSANTNYDVFGYLSGGSVALDCVAWSSNTARATALARQNSVLVKSGAAARRYLGTIRTVSNSGTKVIDARMQRFVWNAYNAVLRLDRMQDTATNWTLPFNSGVRGMNSGVTGIWRWEFVVGLGKEDHVPHAITAQLHVNATSNATAGALFGFGFDTTTAFTWSSGDGGVIFYGTSTQLNAGTTTWGDSPVSGYHYLHALEQGAGASGAVGVNHNSGAVSAMFVHSRR